MAICPLDPYRSLTRRFWRMSSRPLPVVNPIFQFRRILVEEIFRRAVRL
jgi:hypothetical protein